jgi:hypothetical protein
MSRTTITESRRVGQASTASMETGDQHASTPSRNEPILQGTNPKSNNYSNITDDVFRDGPSEKGASHRAPPPPSQTAGQLPAQYERVRAARRINFKACISGGERCVS